MVKKVLNIVVLGASGAGKTSMISQLVENKLPAVYQSAPRAISRTTIFHQKKEYECAITDTASHATYTPISPQIVIGTHAFILVYSLTNRESFDLIRVIREKLVEFCYDNVAPMVIVGSKNDLLSAREVAPEEGINLGRSLEIPHIEATAYSYEQLYPILELCISVVEHPGNLAASAPTFPPLLPSFLSGVHELSSALANLVLRQGAPSEDANPPSCHQVSAVSPQLAMTRPFEDGAASDGSGNPRLASKSPHPIRGRTSENEPPIGSLPISMRRNRASVPNISSNALDSSTLRSSLPTLMQVWLKHQPSNSVLSEGSQVTLVAVGSRPRPSTKTMVRKQDLVFDTDSFVNSVEDSLDILSSFDTGSSRKTWPQSAPEVSNLGHSGSLYSDLAHVFLEISDDRIAARALAQLEGDRAQTILDTLQMILDSEHTSITSGNRARILYLTLQLAKRSGLYPQSLHLTDVTREDTHAVTAGHFGEIWKGRFRGRAVCMKVLKVYQRSDVTKLLRLFAREGILWSHLSHENLLPFYGFHRLDDDAGRMCLISPWAEHGCVRDYLQRNPDVNRYSLVRDSCQGLLYLHNHGIIHGDLKGVNILVTKSRRACVADFGLSAVAESEIMRWTSLASSAGVGGTVRWQAPELFDPNTEEAKPTKMSDVYSLGCVFYEIFTGEIPFHEVSRESTVISHVQSGRQPSKPSQDSLPFSTWGLSEEVWNSCIHQSWSRTPEERPTIPYLLRQLAAVEAEEDRRRGDELRGASSRRPPETWLTAAEVRNSIRMSRGRAVRSGQRSYTSADGGLPSWNEPTRWLQWLRASA